jgi:hypothetical protein
MSISSIKPGTHRNEFRAYNTRSLYELLTRKTFWKDFCWPGISLQGEESLWEEGVAPFQPGTAETPSGFAVYPNPAKGTVFVRLPQDLQAAWIGLYDISGRLVRYMEVNGQFGTLELDVSGLPAGLYWISCLSDLGERRIRRVAIAR